MDTSFPAATITLSNLLPPEEQGVAASLVATVVNYSISLGLGIAGSVEMATNEGGRNVLAGYRSAFYTAVGLSATGVLVSIWFAGAEACGRRKKAQRAGE